MPVRVLEGVAVYDVGGTNSDEYRQESAAAYAGMGRALALLAARAPRVLARLRGAARYVALHRGTEAIGFDPTNRGVSLNRRLAAGLPAERLAVFVGVGATMARFGWANFRPTPDAAAQMVRRVRREAEVLMDALGADDPTREWFAEWHAGLPQSPAATEAMVDRHLADNDVPRWVARLRQYVWR